MVLLISETQRERSFPFPKWKTLCAQSPGSAPFGISAECWRLVYLEADSSMS